MSVGKAQEISAHHSTSVGVEARVPVLIASGIALLALLSAAMPWVRAPAFERPTHPIVLRYRALAPVALLATPVNVALEAAWISYQPLCAMNVGWTERAVTLLISILLIGAIILQLLLGWLGERMNRRRLVIDRAWNRLSDRRAGLARCLRRPPRPLYRLRKPR